MYFLQVLINMTLGTSQNHSQIVVEQRFGIFSFSAGPDFDNICSAQRKIPGDAAQALRVVFLFTAASLKSVE